MGFGVAGLRFGLRMDGFDNRLGFKWSEDRSVEESGVEYGQSRGKAVGVGRSVSDGGFEFGRSERRAARSACFVV
jgi:hypothetical protein